MRFMFEVFRPTLIVAAVCGVIALIFVVVKTGVFSTVPDGTVAVDYVNIVVILLTTVTVLFTIAALALAVLAFYGYRNIQKDAANAAEKAIESKLNEKIRTSFKVGGAAFEEIKSEITADNGALGNWLRNEIEREVTEQLAYPRPSIGVDEDDPSDEGDQE